jgi:membrane protease YdiL (CAAX protease family)
VARPVALVSGRSVHRSGRGHTDLTGHLWLTGTRSARRRLARALLEVAAVFVLQLVLFQLAEEIGFTGFLQHHWQDRYHL